MAVVFLFSHSLVDCNIVLATPVLCARRVFDRQPNIGGNCSRLPGPARFGAANYREMVDTLAEAGCDLLLMEMMLDVEHSTRLMEAALATGLPV